MLDGVAETGLNDGQDFMRNAVSGKRQRGLLADPELRVGQLPVQYKAFALKRGLQPIAQSRQTHGQIVGLGIHGVDDQAQVQQRLLQYFSGRTIFNRGL